MMIKILSVLMMALFLTSASASRLFMGQEQFIDLTEKEKEEYIIKVMEFIVELEGRYEEALKKEGPDSPKTRKYSTLLQNLKSLFIPTAYAETTPSRTSTQSSTANRYDMVAYARDFAEAINPSKDKEGKRCIYGGWISRVDAKNKCIHPARLEARTQEYKYYAKQQRCPQPSINGDTSKDMIACNPAVFGFMNNSAKTPFCVAGGMTKSFNSSYICMKLSLGLDLTRDEKERYAGKVENPSSPQERMALLKEQFSANPELAKNVSNFILKTCLCDGGGSSIINSHYLREIKPHRTCFGLLNMVTNTATCEASTPTIPEFNNDLIKKIKELYNTVSNDPASTSSVDTLYTREINKIRTNFSSDYGKICGLQETPVITVTDDYTCEANCKEEGDSLKCTYKVKKGETLLTDEGLFTKGAEIKGQDAEITIKANSKKIKCSTKFEIAVLPPVTGIQTPAEGPVASTTEENFKCELKLAAEATGTEEKLEVTLQITNPDSLPTQIKWKEGIPGAQNTKVEVPKTSFPVSASVSFKHQGTDKDKECGTINWPAVSASGAKPQLKVEKKENTNDVELKGIVSGPKEGWNIQWMKKGSNPASPSTTTAAPAVSAGMGKDEPDENPQAPRTAQPAAATPPMTKIGDGETIKVNREDKDFEVCGKLVKESETIDGSCVIIPKKSASTPKPSLGGSMPTGPMTPSRPASNTSAQGIR